MGPKLKALLARASLVGGVALVATLVARSAPHEQTIAIRLGGHAVRRVEGVVTRDGEDEPTAGFSQDFAIAAPRVVRHSFSAPTGTYIVVITLKEAAERPPGSSDSATSAGDVSPTLSETTFERRVSLAGGEVIVSPD